MKKWKQRGFAFVLALSLTTGMLTGAQAAVSKETLNEAVQDTAEYMYRTVQNPQVGSIGGEWAVLGLAGWVRCTGQLLSGLLCHCGGLCNGLRRQAAR